MSPALRCAGLGHRYGRGLWGLRDCNLEESGQPVLAPQLTLLTILLALTAAALASGWRATQTRAV